jgi:hypothetical protein
VWQSIDVEHKKLSAMKLRNWVNDLLQRSVFLGSAQEGLGLHDIVRDFTLASLTSAELQQRQLQFVGTLISTVTTTDESRGATIILEYAYSNLLFHVQGAVQPPLHQNSCYLNWLLHPDTNICDQVYQGLGISNVKELAVWLCTEAGGEEFGSAAKLYEIVAQKTRGLSKAEKSRYVHSSIEAIKRAKPGPDADALLGLQCLLRQRILYYSDEQSVVDESANWCITLLDDTDELQKLSSNAQGRVKYAVAAMLLGKAPTVHCLEPSLDQLKRGSILYLEFLRLRCDGMETTSGFTRWYLTGSLLSAHGWHSIAYLVFTPETTRWLLGVNGANVFKFIDLYNFDFHERSVARSGFDFLLSMGFGYALLHYHFAVEREAESAMEQWLVADAKASGLGTGCAYQVFAMWKMLSTLEFARMAGARAISWQTVEARIRVSPVEIRFRYESETGQAVTLHSTDALVQIARAMMILQLPNCVQREDIADFIPTPGE